MKMPKVSVIMPAYNHEKYVGEAIESVLNQLFTDLELIIINDGSTDGTEKVIRRYDDNRIKYYYQDNSGAHNALNKGLSLAKGEYISIINSDDVYHPDRLSCLTEAAEANKSTFIITDVDLIDESSVPLREPSWLQWHDKLMSVYQRTKSLEKTFLSGNIAVTTSNFFFHSIVAKEVGNFNPYRYVHDYDFVLRTLLRYHDTFLFLFDRKLLSYRLHSTNTIKESPHAAMKEMLDLLIKHVPEFIKNKDEKAYTITTWLTWEKDRQIAEKEGQIAEKDRQIEAFLNSYSWRITAPLRYLHGNASPNINKLINIIKPRKLEEGQQGFEAYQVKILNPIRANRPRIVHALANFMTGGSSRLVVDLIENLGHLYEQEVITSHSPSPPCYKGLALHELKSSKKIADYLLKFRPGLVHVHYWGELDKEWYDKIFIAASDYGCKIIENINTPVEPYVADSINSYVYVSDYVRKHYGKDDGKNITIYPGSNFNIFDRHGDIADIPDNCIGMVYRLEPDKLNIQSIDVFIKVAQRRPEIKVLIVGGGSFLETYRTAAIAGGVINSFTFTDYVSYEELPKLYEEMSIFVAPVWKESFGQVSPFAMNMGIPVVGYDIGALSEIIEDKTLLARPGDSDRLAEIIIDLLGNREKRLLIGRRNRDRAQAFFSDEAMVKKYEKLYETLIKGQS